MAKNNMINCKSCGSEIAASAKICPKCGAKNKKPIYKRVWFWIVAVILLFAIIGGSGDDASTSSTKEPEIITYESVSIEDLFEAKEENAAAAKDTYNKKYIEFTGKLSTIDSDLKYISVASFSDSWLFYSIHCSITSEEQKEIIKTLKTDDSITIRGKVTDVGEVMGYYVDIKEIVK